QESVDKMVEKGAGELNPGDFAENVTTQGITWYELPVGTRFQAGDVVFELTQIGKECHHGCAIYQRIGDCVMPREGIFAKVIQPGIMKPGDAITML
ncbi:MOSC domain-containing protein, partial [Eubacteriales bacterium OttesenSCG-928-M02]|nr:MOSC domain-containing protein [Eubacteriales bacterium OttesenSCG-928-M02]